MTDNEEDETSKDVPEEEEHLDTIEKIIDSREGKKGGRYRYICQLYFCRGRIFFKDSRLFIAIELILRIFIKLKY